MAALGRVRSIFRRKSERQQASQQQQQPAKQHDPNRSPIPLRFQDQQQAAGSRQHQLQTQSDGANDARVPATRSGQLQISLRNATNSDTPVYAYITGSAIDRGGQLFLLSADGRTPYYPPNPAATGTRIAQDISIPLGAPGSKTTCVIPRLAGGRIWFSIGRPLVFAVNPGPGLIEPSVFNQSDPNISTRFGFAEFTFNEAQVFANISYVDFVSLPISLTLRSTTAPNSPQHVAGLPPNGLDLIAAGLRAQTQKDGRRWSSLVVPRKNNADQPLRILSPNSALLLNPGWFRDYWQPYIDRVWDSYRFKQLTVDTQAAFGEVDGQVRSSDGLFDFGPGGAFAKPSTADVFSCSTGPFATGANAERNAIIPRLAAACNRSTLLLSQETPNGTRVAEYYTTPITNHYSRIVHEANIDNHGYAFPYDDVTPDGGVPQEGAVFSFSPEMLTVAVGGR